MCAAVRGCMQVWASLHGYGWVWAGVHGYALVCACVLDEFSEFLPENRVPTSADFNTYPIRILFINSLCKDDNLLQVVFYN